MDYHNYGQTIKLLRKQQKVTQGQLAEGIMDRENLSKVENGRHGISKRNLDLLLNKLGYSAKQFFPYPLNKREFDVYVLRDQVNKLLARLDTKEVEKRVTDMDSLPEFQNGLHKQILLKSKASLCLWRDNDPISARVYLDEAIRITIPKFTEKLVNTYMLGQEDIDIVGMMAEASYLEGKHGEAITLLKKLAESIRKRYVDPSAKARSLTFVLYNLTCFLGVDGKYDEALELCNEAIEAGESNREFANLPELNYNKAYCLFHIDPKADIEDFLYKAYYGHLLHGEKDAAEGIRKRAMKNFRINIRKSNT